MSRAMAATHPHAVLSAAWAMLQPAAGCQGTCRPMPPAAGRLPASTPAVGAAGANGDGEAQLHLGQLAQRRAA